MISALILPQTLRAQIAREARAALPCECCGLIEGTRRFDVVEACAVHATHNLAQAMDRFEIDPARHIRLLRAAREAGREIVGCYHSHPNGKTEPSVHDRQNAGDEYLWLIAAVSEEAFELRAFVAANGQFVRVVLAEEASSS